jgi:hypothetical protein
MLKRQGALNPEFKLNLVTKEKSQISAVNMLFQGFRVRDPFEYFAALITFVPDFNGRMTDTEPDENPSPDRVTRLGYYPRMAPRIAASAFFLICIFWTHSEL